jgi:hypothetical protein
MLLPFLALATLGIIDVSYYYGGARRSRTADLLNAIQALSQLSYGPIRNRYR